MAAVLKRPWARHFIRACYDLGVPAAVRRSTLAAVAERYVHLPALLAFSISLAVKRLSMLFLCFFPLMSTVTWSLRESEVCQFHRTGTVSRIDTTTHRFGSYPTWRKP